MKEGKFKKGDFGKKKFKTSSHELHGPLRMLKDSLGDIDEFETKEEAVTFLKMKSKTIQQLEDQTKKELELSDKVVELFSSGIQEVEKSEEYSSDELRSFLKKGFLDLKKEIWK